jgi:hypothetical protein
MTFGIRAAKYLSERKERSLTSEAPKLEDPYDLSRLTDDELGSGPIKVLAGVRIG